MGIHSSMSSNQIYLEELLEDCNFGLDLVSNQVVSAFVIDDLNLEEIESLHELLPKIVEAFESLGLAYDEDRLDQCLLLLSKSAFYQALKRLNEFRNESECLVFLQDEEIWLSATLTTDIDLTKNTVNVLIYQFGLEKTLNVKNVRILSNDKDIDIETDDEAESKARAANKRAHRRSKFVGICELCETERTLTRHHLIPRQLHNKLLKQKRGYDKTFLNNHCAEICRPCHNAVHNAESNSSLAADFNSVEKLKTHPKIIRWVEYWKTKA